MLGKVKHDGRYKKPLDDGSELRNNQTTTTHRSLACAWMLKQLHNVNVNFANVHEMFCPVEYTQSPTVHDWSLSDS